MSQSAICVHLTNTMPTFLASPHKGDDCCDNKSKSQKEQGDIAFFHCSLFMFVQILTPYKSLYVFFLVICQLLEGCTAFFTELLIGVKRDVVFH